MYFKSWLLTEAFEWVTNAEVPPEPGKSPKRSANHVRLYHYTTVEGPTADEKHAAAELLRKNGLDISKAKGSTYGEPNVVWASSQLPQQGKVFAEFSIAMDDPRWAQGKPPEGQSPEEYEAMKWDGYFFDSIKPQEILAVHEPWHARYRYMQQNTELIQEAKEGKFDYLLDDNEYGPAVMKVKMS